MNKDTGQDIKESKSWLSKIKFFQKLKTIKHFEVIVAVLFCAILLLIYFSSSIFSSTSESTSVEYNQKTSLSVYTEELETRLKNTLESISGAGSVSVMISFAGPIEYVYATDVETKTNSINSGQTTQTTQTTNENIITISVNGTDEPIVLKEIMPAISGVLVVASGAENTNVKLEILRALQAVLDVSNSKVEILTGK